MELPLYFKIDVPTHKLSDLPTGARQYVDTIQELLEVPVKFISIGPDREETILL